MKKTMLMSALALCFLVGCTPNSKQATPDLIEEKFNAESWKTMIPEECQNFYDGCNHCFRTEDGKTACTRMYCETYAMPKCTDEEVSAENSLENEENASNTYEGDMVQHEDITPYLNKTLEEIQDITQTQEISIRIVSEDGEAFPVTADYNPSRLNVELMSGIIVNAFFG